MVEKSNRYTYPTVQIKNDVHVLLLLRKYSALLKAYESEPLQFPGTSVEPSFGQPPLFGHLSDSRPATRTSRLLRH